MKFIRTSAGADLTRIATLRENADIAFQGPVKVGKFELDSVAAQKLLRLPNVNGRANSEVIKPWFNGGDITDRPLHRWIIDFGKMSEREAAFFEAPFAHIKKVVYPVRVKNRDSQRRENWWRLGRSGGNLRDAVVGLTRVLVTSRVSKHRFFIWAPPNAVPDTRVVAFAKDSDYFCGVLHSTVHLAWFLTTSSRHGDGDVGGRPTYNPSTCFDTFPFPWPPGKEPMNDPHVQAVGAAARTLVELRDKWLDPPGASEAELKKRTLTNLYNERPEWLANVHRDLDEAVFAAYGWPSTLRNDEIVGRLLALNRERAK
jgi:type II restriction/modification system DNA methylase subunit YeeA